MEGVQVISTSTVSAAGTESNHNSGQIIDLTSWDLQFLSIEFIQKGLIFPSNEKHATIQIQHSLSSTLAFFPPLAGRLVILQHQDNIVSSSRIICNNAGALFVHTIAPTTTVADILQPKHIPPILRAFFPLNGVQNHQTSLPLLAVQVTELLGGIFIAIAINHVVTDVTPFWHLVNSWTQISRGSHKIARLPLLQRFFPDGVDPPFRFAKLKQSPTQIPLDRAVFHFAKEKIAELKAKANAEANTDKISSQQALLTLLWRSVIRCQRVEPHEDLHCMVLIGVRNRMVPQLAEDYFGNAVLIGRVTMKAGELLQGGIGRVLWTLTRWFLCTLMR